jgi:cell division protein ZapB
LYLTESVSRPTISPMTDTITRINKLEEQVNELLELCQKLGNDNKDLRAQLQTLTSERSNLIESKEKVRVQVESMITRLRSMEKA